VVEGVDVLGSLSDTAEYVQKLLVYVLVDLKVIAGAQVDVLVNACE
jgi:hypothetical protein